MAQFGNPHLSDKSHCCAIITHSEMKPFHNAGLMFSGLRFQHRSHNFCGQRRVTRLVGSMIPLLSWECRIRLNNYSKSQISFHVVACTLMKPRIRTAFIVLNSGGLRFDAFCADREIRSRFLSVSDSGNFKPLRSRLVQSIEFMFIVFIKSTLRRSRAATSGNTGLQLIRCSERKFMFPIIVSRIYV